jgi:ABC-2 type transport system permease protein
MAGSRCMRTIIYIWQKEVIQLLRNRVMLRILIVMPLLQLLVLAYAATFEIKLIRLLVVDLDHSRTSRELVRKFDGSPFYHIVDFSHSTAIGEEQLLRGSADQVITIPVNFEKDLAIQGDAKVQVISNAINGSAASLMNAYSLSIIRDFNINLLAEQTSLEVKEPFQVTYSYWHNPELDYKNYMVPGILVLLVTIISMFFSGLSLVREKEIGTIEQINVTPVRKHQFILGKLVPFWVLANLELIFGLVLARLIFNIPMVGSIWLIFLVAAAYLVVTLSMGLFVSTKTNTQQQAMFISWFFLVIFILMSGLFTPIESMPSWAQVITWFNPIAYFIEAIRMIMLKGSGLADVLRHLSILAVYGAAMLFFAVWQYRKVA